jgi:hypothetical protein
MPELIAKLAFGYILSCILNQRRTLWRNIAPHLNGKADPAALLSSL